MQLGISVDNKQKVKQGNKQDDMITVRREGGKGGPSGSYVRWEQ